MRASATGAEGSSMLVEEEVSIFAKVVVPRANAKENPGGIPGEKTQFPGQRPAPANGSREVARRMAIGGTEARPL